MARFSEDDFAALRAAFEQDAARALGAVRREQGDVQNETTNAWLDAGDNLAEKAIAALDLGDDARARALATRIVGLPLVDRDVLAGLMAVHLLLFAEILDPAFEDDVPAGVLDAPLRLLPTLEPRVATELRRVLDAVTDYPMPAALLRRVHAAVGEDLRDSGPFEGVPESALPDTVLGVLGVVLALRAGEEKG